MKCASNNLAARLPSRPAPWLAAFAIWFGVLWWLSSGHRDMPLGEEIRYIDKIYHFGYYFGGAILLGSGLIRPAGKVRKPLLMTVVAIALVGAIDEFHQSFVPGRSGNDPADWTADVSGGICGAWLACRFLRPKV
jgi:VanZ family protein